MSASIKTRDFVRICLFASLIAVLGLIPKMDLPLTGGVPITAQTFGVMLAGTVLGARNGAFAVMLFVFVVALGMPFLAGGRGGLGVFFGPTGGFLLGWIPGAWVAGKIMASKISSKTIFRAFLGSIFGGIVVVYACGIPWLALFAKMNLSTAALASTVFVPGDILKAIAVAALVSTLPPRQLG